jgi:hypothetical protein
MVLTAAEYCLLMPVVVIVDTALAQDFVGDGERDPVRYLGLRIVLIMLYMLACNPDFGQVIATIVLKTSSEHGSWPAEQHVQSSFFQRS